MTVIAAADIELEIDGMDAQVARRLLARRAAAMRVDAVSAASGPAVLTWTLRQERFALPLADVALVLRADRTTPVPGAPPALIGIAVRRGRLLNVVDPSPALGQDAADGARSGHLLVLRGTMPRLALLVDRADAVVAIAAGEDAERQGLTRQAALADGGRLLIVDKDRLVEAMGLAGQQRGR